MCRLFAMTAGRQRVTACLWLLDAPDSLAVQSRKERDGTGLGWYDEAGVPHVEKQALAAYEDAAFAREARELRSRTFIAHVRYASTGAVELANTHPFEEAGRLFAHNGVLQDLPALDRELGDHLGLVHGDTDSERFFALVTKEAERDGDVGAAITRAAGWVADHVPVYALNIVLITADELWALRYPDTHELYVLERSPGAGQLRHKGSAGNIRVHSDDLAAVVVATERMDADPGWALIEPGHLLHVDADLNVTSTLAVDHPPARLLTLADLDDRAAASQVSADSEQSRQ